jgi:hypothetical protein
MQEGQNRTIRAILTGAIQESDGPLYNVGTALNSFVYNTIVGWCAANSYRSLFFLAVFKCLRSFYPLPLEAKFLGKQFNYS